MAGQAGEWPEPTSQPPEPTSQPRPDPDLAARMVPGGTFILDAPKGVPSVWGDGDQVAWAEGEPFLLVGPQGVGKTTLAQQLVLARLGMASAVLGMPVVEGGRRVLYLACDRPAQVQRSFGRMVGEQHRAALDARLVVWPGPPPGDFARHPDLPLRMCEAADADTLVVDSTKDVALKLSDDEVGAALNSAHQRLVVEGVQLLGLHHQRKRGADGGKPKSLDDVYGSVWITAGCGSVVLLWGQAGDLIVELSHLKQPGEPIGPLKVLHDHRSGISSVVDKPDLVHLAAISPSGITTKDAAVGLFDTLAPDRNQVEKARRALDNLAAHELLWKVPGSRGGGADRDQTRYVAAAHHEEQ
jgi:replicative DNA helicase